MNVSHIPTTKIDKDHPKDQIIGDINSAIQTRRMTKISDEHSMKVWRLVDLPNGKRAIGTKWVFRNKKDERGIFVRNKARLVAQGYTQEEGIDNESTICIMKNPVFHSKTKHIEIRHHFIKDSYEKKLIQVIKIHTDHNVADLLTKAFDVSRFNFLIASIGLLNLGNETVYKEWEDRMERAATTASSFEVEHDSGSGPRCQDTILGGTKDQSRFEVASKQSNVPPLSRVNILRSGEDNMKLMELMEHCTTLSELVRLKE
ncbi:putative ribonuclease H-like domain-containing protein [Tanacetum coccineum]